LEYRNAIPPATATPAVAKIGFDCPPGSWPDPTDISLPLADNHFGFLPTRGTFMLDFVFVAMFLIVLTLGISIYLVRQKRKFQLHKRIQLVTALVLLITVVAFEIDVRFFVDWKELAKPSRFYDSGWVHRSLWIHLIFAVPTPLIWVYTIVMALRRFPDPPQPSDDSPHHKRWGWVSAIMMCATAATGWVFYVLAFIL
jgi:uncharacterized membrane protein YozB (DUF420 family)